MKHLKKLSVVLMMTTLFSVSFTSCIDNEVSPVVEAIYEAQADLLAAQAGVQNAEAALLLAQAQNEQAMATWRTAQAAQVAAYTAGITADNAYEAAQRVQWLLELVAETKVAVDKATKDLALAQVQFDADMAVLMATMKAAGAANAVIYAGQYATAMAEVTSLKSQKATAEGELALLELYLKAGTPQTTWALYLADLNADVAVQNGKITAAQAAIVALNAAKANPTATETQIAGLKSQVAVLTARQTTLIGLKALAQQDVTNAQAAITAATAFMADPAGPYAMAKASLTFWKNAYTVDSTAVKANTLLVAQHTAAITNYVGTTASLTLTKNTYVTAVGQSATLPYTGLKGDIKTLENTLGVYGTAGLYGATPRPATTAQNILWNADLALLKFNTDFAALTASYNLAANNLVTATNTFNTGNWAALNTAASVALTAAQGDVTTATTYYNLKKGIFEAAPAGITWFDLITPLGNTSGGADLYTNVFIGNHDDAITTSYRRVLTWAELVSGSGNFYPATYATTSVATIPADVVGPPAVDNEGFTGTPLATATPTIVYYVEVELDDASATNVALFNDASTKLGVKITAPYYTITPPSTFRVYALDNAGDTAYKALWNAEKLVSERLYLQANAVALLAEAQEEYNYQKGLFEAGLTTRTTLEGNVAAAKLVIGQTTTLPFTGLLGDIDAKSKQLGTTDFGTAPAGGTAKTTAGTLGSDYYFVGTVKTLTAYAMKWNAELALANHVALTLVQHQTMLTAAQAALTTATREAAEDLVYIAKFTADLAALQAKYDAYMLTPLNAALNVTLVNKQQALATLVAEESANASMITSLGLVITGLEATVTVTNYTALIAAQNLIITNAKAALLADQLAISQGNVTLADLQRAVQIKKDLIATLTVRIANALAIAAKYKALMDAALVA